jgi:hypothetical protein
MLLTADTGFDAALLDKENRTVALIRVKATPVVPNWEPIIKDSLARLPEPVDYVLAIDLSFISVFRVDNGQLEPPVAQLETPEVLKRYDPDFSNQRIFERYLLTLVEGWLRDLAYHWKSKNPPGADELRNAGLLDRLEDGTTQRPGE